jgi:hypothetical protein
VADQPSIKKQFPYNSTPKWVKVFEALGIVMSRVGIVGFAVLSIVIYIFWFVPQEKKNEITDTWLLFKTSCSFSVGINISLLILFIIQQYFYGRQVKAKTERIDELSIERNKLQELLIGGKPPGSSL